jgi:hypothetical protein
MKNIRSKVVKQSLLDYNTLAKSLQENTEGAVKNLLSETVRDTYAKLLSEGDDFDEDEVDDVDGGVEDAATDAGNSDDADIDTGDDSDIDAGTDADAADDIEGGEGADADGDDWAEFDKYKVSDDEYDFSNAEDEEIVKVYKLMKNDDQILVHKDDDKVKIQDNETGAEYIVDLGGDDSASFGSDDEFDGGEDFDDDEDIDGGESDFELEAGDDSDDEDFDDDADLDGDMAEFGDDDEDFDDEDFDDEEGEDTFELETDDDGEDIEDEDDFSDEDSDDNNEDEKDNMKESTERMFELVLEYKSDLGYTDNYQNKDVMTTPDMSEPGKNVNDWDAGVPKGKSKPWSGKKGGKKENQPFDGEKGKTVEEGAVNELKTNAEHSANVGSTSRTDGPNNPRGRKGRSFHTAQNGQETGTGDNAYKKSGNGGANNVDIDIKVENTLRKINKTLKENKELKNTLGTVMTSLKEAAVTNHNLAQIIKLISENSTTREEKEEIIRKFANEAKTIDASKALYESLSNDLKKAKKMNITEGALFSAESSKKINETPIYKSQDIMESLDLMHRMMK